MNKTLDKAKTGVAYAQVGLAAVSTVYLTVVIADGIRQEIKDRRDRRRLEKLAASEED